MFGKHLFFDKLIVTVIVYIFSHYVTYTLGFNILKVRISVKQLVPSICIMTFYSLFAKLFLSLNSYNAVMIPLIIILLAVTEKKAIKGINVFSISNILKLSWTALIMIFINAVGFIVVIAPLSLNSEVAQFFNATVYGYNAACVIETLFVALVLFVLTKFPKVTLIPPIKDKIDMIDIVAVITYFAMLSVTYSASVTFVTSLAKDPQHVFGNLLYQWLTTLIIVPGHYMIIRNMKKKNVKLEEDKKRIEEERNRLAEEKNRIEIEKDQMVIEKAQIVAEKNQLEEGKNRLEEEKNSLLSQVEKLIEMNKAGKSIEAQRDRELLFEIYEKTRNIFPPNIKIDDSNNISKGQSILNIISGKNNEELKDILGVSERQLDIIHLIAQGKVNKQIADSLGLAEGTVKNHVSDIFGKFNVNDRNHLVAYIMDYLVKKE